MKWIKSDGKYGPCWTKVVPANVRKVEIDGEHVLVCNFGESEYDIVKCSTKKEALEFAKRIIKNGDSKEAITINTATKGVKMKEKSNE